MVQHRKIVAEFEDRYGDQRVIVKARNGLQLQRRRSTAAQLMTKAAGKLIGERIRKTRIASGMSMEELCIRAGLSTATPKQRMYEIEKSTREGGIKTGTVYAIAYALGVSVASLFPTVEEVMREAGIQAVQLPPTLTPSASAATSFRVVGSEP